MRRIAWFIALSAALAVSVARGQTSEKRAGSRRSAPSQSNGADWHGTGTHGAVSAGGQGAVLAGIRVLKDGGNAADAGAATILALSVTDAASFCFGGEVPILAYDAKRKVVEVIAGQGGAPRLASRQFFEERGGIPARGVEPAAVPAAP